MSAWLSWSVKFVGIADVASTVTGERIDESDASRVAMLFAESRTAHKLSASLPLVSETKSMLLPVVDANDALRLASPNCESNDTCTLRHALCTMNCALHV